MIQTLQTRRPPRLTAWALAILLALPLMTTLTGCGRGGNNATDNAPTNTSPANTPGSATAPTKPGMSNTKKAVIVLAGAALLYYIYRKHQASQQAQGGAGGQQLYRSKNGGIYYRNAQHQPVWVTAPAQGVSVPADQLQKYAPDYQQYQGQDVPPAPSGYATQPATEYDPSLASG